MTALTHILMLTSAFTSTSPPQIRYSDHEFVVSGLSDRPEHVSVDATPKLGPSKVEFRDDATYVLWDERGLTVRAGGHVASTRFKEVPTSPRLRSRDTIKETLNQVKRGGRKLEATCLSGARRCGKTVYLVVRWEDHRGSTWLEALVSVDLSAKQPAPKALAVLPGTSFSSGPIADSLVSDGSTVSILVHDGPKWGIWAYDAQAQQSSFHSIGDRVKYAAPVNAEQGVFVEKNSLGGYEAGLVDIASGTRTDATDGPALWKVVGPKSPVVVQGSNDAGADELIDLGTGAILPLPDGAEAKRAGADILVWVGGRSPKKAWLYDPETWKPLAWWRAASG